MRDRYKIYMLSLLMVIMAFNFMDRFALGLVLQDIKGDLKLSDTQLGLMTGIAFAFFYAIMGIPIARWADAGNRVTIIALTAALWSIMVTLCGRAANFSQLLLIRVGVGVGEAGCIPPAHSLIADHFTRAERPRAQAFYQMGVPLSLLLGYFCAGWLNELFGWRMMFMLLGLPGIVLSALVWLTLREPRSAEPEPDARLAIDRSAETPTFRSVSRTLLASPSFRHLLLGFSIMYFFGYGVQQWQPTYLIRRYGLTTGQLGTWLAMVFGFGGFIGTYLGGSLASRYATGDESLQLKGIAAAYGALCILSIATYLSSNMYLAFGFLTACAIGQYATTAPLLATIQTLVPERMRATAIAVIYLCANLVGMGLGPLAVGMLSDALHGNAGTDALRIALLVLSPGYLWVAWHLYRASTTVAVDIDVVDRSNGRADAMSIAKAHPDLRDAAPPQRAS